MRSAQMVVERYLSIFSRTWRPSIHDILAYIGYDWLWLKADPTHKHLKSRKLTSCHMSCSCPFFLSFPIISNLPNTHPNIMVGGETAHILRSHSKVGLVKHRETSPETLRDSRLWNNGRESWQLVTNVFQGWANPIHFSRCYNVV